MCLRQFTTRQGSIAMKKFLPLAGFCLALAGCTFTAADKLGPGQYQITSSGSIFNSREGLLENINQKAAKVCGGKYHLEGDTNANMLASTYTSVGPTPTTVLGLKAICDSQ